MNDLEKDPDVNWTALIIILALLIGLPLFFHGWGLLILVGIIIFGHMLGSILGM